MDFNFCEECEHQEVCLYQETTNRIVNNINVDLKHFPANLTIQIDCKHKTLIKTESIRDNY